MSFLAKIFQHRDNPENVSPEIQEAVKDAMKAITEAQRVVSRLAQEDETRVREKLRGHGR